MMFGRDPPGPSARRAAIRACVLLIGQVTASRTLWRNLSPRALGKHSHVMCVFQNLLVPLADACWPLSTLSAADEPAGGRLAYIGLSITASVAAVSNWHV